MTVANIPIRNFAGKKHAKSIPTPKAEIKIPFLNIEFLFLISTPPNSTYYIISVI